MMQPTEESNGQPLVSVRELTKRYDGRVILDSVSLSVRANETIALIGPSGGGKSTLLRCINGLNRWDSGEIGVGPHTLTSGEPSWSAGAVTRAARRIVGMVFQDFQLFPHLTALANVAEAPRRVLGLRPEAALKKGRELLDRVGLSQRADAYPGQLSGGQKQRVAIARALAMQPRGRPRRGAGWRPHRRGGPARAGPRPSANRAHAAVSAERVGIVPPTCRGPLFWMRKPPRACSDRLHAVRMHAHGQCVGHRLS